MRDDFIKIVYNTAFLDLDLWQWAGFPAYLILAYSVAHLTTYVLNHIFEQITRTTPYHWDDYLLDAARPPSRLFFALLFVLPAPELFRLPEFYRAKFSLLLQIAFIIDFSWFFLRLTYFVARYIQDSVSSLPDEDPKRKRVTTRVVVLRRISSIVVVVFGSALVLTRFEMVREIGMSLLASAGIAGIVLGLAAQKSISSIISGIQLALTQPIRMGDTVIVDDESGLIEEIHITYVVVKLWDQRRLVVPIHKFLDNSFQNWTRNSLEINGTIEIYANYSVPVEQVRSRLQELTSEHPLWDGRVCTLQMTEATQHAVKLRALVSASNAANLWDLRCDLREKLIAFLRKLENGDHLPRFRIDAGGKNGEGKEEKSNSATRGDNKEVSPAVKPSSA